MEGLLTRRSVRQFTDQQVSKETIEELIKAAQYAPTAHNKQPWEFLVIDDKETLAQLRTVQRFTSFAKDAAKVIMVCGNKDEAFQRDEWNYLDIDCAAATQNLLLAAHAKGLGACWCGISPMTPTIEKVIEKFNLPENIKPFSFVVLGYQAAEPKQPEDRFKPEKIHWQKW